MDRETARKILGVEPGASPEQVHQAYRRLAPDLHPDTTPIRDKKRAEGLFKLADQARACLEGDSFGSVNEPHRKTYREAPETSPQDLENLFNSFFSSTRQPDRSPHVSETARTYEPPQPHRSYATRETTDYSWFESPLYLVNDIVGGFLGGVLNLFFGR